MENLITVIHILAAAGVIGLVLLQHGKGADMGAAFGSGASGSLFGVSGSSNFMSKATAACVVVFFATSLTLAYMASHRAGNGSVIKGATKSESVTTTVAPAATTETKPEQATPAGSAAKDIPN
ncbi:MAG TPA: preprotein translocase subunit SecG [Methylotenera sp.]|nr:preprotein translocase subunit SecG [Methylotenera sp.]